MPINIHADKLMKLKNIVVLLLLFLAPVIAANAKEKVSFELPRINVIQINESETERQYELYIKLPEEYSKNSDKAYPVIYFTDAIWHVELLSASTEFIMENAILVGISWQTNISEVLKNDVGAYASRFRDYTLVKSRNQERQAKYQFGEASNHLEFIREDVIQYVESHYRADPAQRTYFGYSAGGLFGAYVLLAKPDTFKNYILGSPSVKGDIPYLTELEFDKTLRLKSLNANVFISYGSLEDELSEHIESYITLLNSRNDKGLSLKRSVIEGSHQTAFPMTGVSGVTWLSNLTDLTTTKK